MDGNLCKYPELFEVSLDDFSPTEPFLDAPGVYALADAKGKVIYIGQSRAMKTRCRQHSARQKWKADICDAAFYPLPDEEARLLLETLLILRHRPRRNRAIKLGLRKDGGLFEIQFVKGKSTT